MNKKIDVEVVIGGKPYTLSGYESSDYLQRIAMHINGKIAEFRAQEGYARLETELKNVLLAINLSDIRKHRTRSGSLSRIMKIWKKSCLI